MSFLKRHHPSLYRILLSMSRADGRKTAVSWRGMVHGAEQLQDRVFLLGREADPAVKQRFKLRGQLHHLALRKKLRHRDAEARADRLQRGD